jgi:uncharacterized membrane protein YqjE
VIGRLLGLSLWLPLKDRLFRRLFVGEGVALLADQMFLISLTLLVLEVAGPGAQLGSVLAVASIPGALLMLVGGSPTVFHRRPSLSSPTPGARRQKTARRRRSAESLRPGRWHP